MSRGSDWRASIGKLCFRSESPSQKKKKKNYSIDVRTISYLRRYCSGVPNFLAFGTPHESLFLLFDVPNAKYLAFGTPDDSALSVVIFLFFILFWKFVSKI